MFKERKEEGKEGKKEGGRERGEEKQKREGMEGTQKSNNFPPPLPVPPLSQGAFQVQNNSMVGST